MRVFPPPSAVAPWDLPGIQELRHSAPPRPALGADWALVVFCTFAAPPAMVLVGLLNFGSAPVAFWLAACALFFTGLALSLRLEPLPPKRVFDAAAVDRRATPARILLRMRPMEQEKEPMETWLPDLEPGLSRAAILEQLAKLRERGDLSNAELVRARQELLGE